MKLRQRISEIEEALDELEKLLSMDEGSFLRNRTARFSARYSIVQIVEAAADLGIYILERRFNELSESYRDVFRKLSLHGIISPNTAESMSRLAALRNMVVHRYWDIDDSRLYREAKSCGLESVRRFIKEVMDNLPEKD